MRLPRRAMALFGAESRSFSDGYKNMWGSNAPKDLETQHKSPTVKGTLANMQGDWKLDWEEDGRFVEWRRDLQGQSKEERTRVQKEWTKFRRNHGRDRVSLWDEDLDHKTGFHRGDKTWWREQYYEYEYAGGGGGVRSMDNVKQACKVLGIESADDYGAIRAAYLRLVGKHHPDRYQLPREKEAAAEEFRKVSDAYNLLKETRDS